MLFRSPGWDAHKLKKLPPKISGSQDKSFASPAVSCQPEITCIIIHPRLWISQLPLYFFFPSPPIDSI